MAVILLDAVIIGINTGQDACAYTDATETGNWSVMDTPCRLTKESWVMGGILFWLIFVASGIFRMALRTLLRIKITPAAPTT